MTDWEVLNEFIDTKTGVAVYLCANVRTGTFRMRSRIGDGPWKIDPRIFPATEFEAILAVAIQQYESLLTAMMYRDAETS